MVSVEFIKHLPPDKREQLLQCAEDMILLINEPRQNAKGRALRNAVFRAEGAYDRIAMPDRDDPERRLEL